MSSASAAKISETNAADSAAAAQNAVGGFGLEVGTTTTGDPGTDAAVEIQKTGTKYTANFTIPRGDIGPAGVNENVPIGSTSGVVAQATDAYPALPRKVQVHGRTVENFWKYKDGKNKDVNISIDDSGLITFSSDTTGLNRYALFFDFPDEYLEPGKYTIYNWSRDPNIRTGINAEYGGGDAQIDGTSQCNANSSSTFEVISGRGYRFSINLESRTVGKAFTSYVRVMIVKGENVLDEFVPSGVNTVEPEKLVIYGKSEQENKSEVNLPSDISLADGDALTIDRDGTTQIIHAEGEPTVLDNVTLPELPAPTFNVYTAGGYIQPTVDVTYERDVNLALDHEIPHDVTLVGNGTKSSPLGVGDLSSRYTPTTTTTALDTRVKALEMIDGTFINLIDRARRTREAR